jgi:hypothetical protein
VHPTVYGRPVLDGRADSDLHPNRATGGRAATPTPLPGTVRPSSPGHPVLTVVAGLIVAIAYCSWPIGLAVNPAVTRGDLVSSLYLHGQPYNWLFIALDCVVGVGALAVAAAAWPPPQVPFAARLRTALVCYGVFGAITAIDALMPSGCDASRATGCATDLNQLNLDDILTAISVFALFLAAVFVLAHAFGTRRRVGAVGPALLTAAWSICGLLLFAAHFSAQAPVTLQHVMLAMSSAVALTVPLLLVPSRLAATPADRGGTQPPVRGRGRRPR